MCDQMQPQEHMCACADPSYSNVSEYVTAFNYNKIEYTCLLLSRVCSLKYVLPKEKLTKIKKIET